jgi:hypothetical protein
LIDVEAALREHIAYLTDEREPDGLHHPSSTWSSCSRRAVYALRGTPVSNPHDSATQRLFWIGRTLHELAREALSTAPGVARYLAEVEIRGEHEAGHADALVQDEAGDWTLYEYKSTRETHPKLDPQHEAQARHYAVRARLDGIWTETGERVEPLGDALRGIAIVYLGKVALEVTEYRLLYDPSWEARVTDRIADLDGYMTSGDLPPKITDDHGRRAPACFQCPWMTLCTGLKAPARRSQKRAPSEQVEGA